MKKNIILSAMISLLVSGAVMYYAFQKMEESQNSTVLVQDDLKVPLHNVLYTANEEGEMIPLDFAEIAEKVKDAVVHIQSISNYSRSQTYDPLEDLMDDPFYEFFFGPQSKRKSQPQQRQRRGSGSGVIISNDGYIVTNNHVVKDADEIEITLLNKEKYVAQVVGTDPTTDIALLKIDAQSLPTLSFFDSDQVRVGEWVMAVGNPFNLNSTVTAGIVSAKGRSIKILDENYAVESFIQTDAAINPGNSGGALVNLKGDLLGINTAIASPTGSYAGYGFAVPSNIVNKVINDLMQYGIVQRGFLGVMIKEVNADLVKAESLKINRGVFVDSLTGNSAAAKAGVKVGDVILAVDGMPVNSVPELQELIARKRPGDAALLSVNRKGTEKSYNVMLNNKDGKQGLLEGLDTIEEELGAVFMDIDTELKNTLDIEGGVKISKLSDGLLKRYTDIREGFIITKVDNRTIQNKDQLIRYLNAKNGGVLIEGRYENKPGVYYYGLGI